jgi:hypothetical protein
MRESRYVSPFHIFATIIIIFLFGFVYVSRLFPNSTHRATFVNDDHESLPAMNTLWALNCLSLQFIRRIDDGPFARGYSRAAWRVVDERDPMRRVFVMKSVVEETYKDEAGNCVVFALTQCAMF